MYHSHKGILNMTSNGLSSYETKVCNHQQFAVWKKVF